MTESQSTGAKPTGNTEQSFAISAPQLSLPKGGGAVRGMGEKFAANPVTGTGSMSVPIATSPGRGGFGPQLALSYDSGAGNGLFGLGWSLSLPSIVRKTDKGLPRYLDDEESDVFILAGAEDLVPVTDATGKRVPPTPSTVYGTDYLIRRYLPRVEGLFALIERWTKVGEPGDTFWRTISRDNVTTWYGRSDDSRVSDPQDSTRIFQWFVCETYDDKGSVAVHDYFIENAEGVDKTALWEANRSDTQRTANRYPKSIRYGNLDPFLPTLAASIAKWPDPSEPPGRWMFEVAFDYGQYADGPSPTSAKQRVRADPFSSHRSGFEVRTYRLCERVLMFHHFEAELGAKDYLVRSTDFKHEQPLKLDDASKPGYTVLRSVTHWSYQKATPAATTYERRQLPPVVFTYSVPAVDPTPRTIPSEQLQNLPVGTQGPGYQWVDLDGEGLSGVLAEQAGSWYFKPNLGDATFGAMRLVARQPAMAQGSAGRHQFMDLSGNGEIDVVDFSGPTPGFHERDRDDGWKRHVPFASLPNIDWQDPNLRFVDLTGDGHADALITEQDVFTWYPSLDERGFAASERTHQPQDENAGPKLAFADGTQTIFLADMCGDGLTDLVRVRNGEVCYWSNLGYGHFGRKITLGNPPRFDHPDLFDPRRIRLSDIDGSGPIDIIYLGRDGARLYFNRSGNALSNPLTVALPVATDNLGAVQVTDLLGNGTACLVWNSHLPADASHPVHYIELMGGAAETQATHRTHEKPHLLTKVDNNLGGTTEIQYTPSTRFYLQDQLNGTPWVTLLPFPVHCVSKVTVRDKWRGTAFSSTYSYHHGYFDGTEREFRGFGRVEQVDVEDYGKFLAGNVASPWITDDFKLYQPPVQTITWYHTGAALERRRILDQFAHEYFPQRFAAQLPSDPTAFYERPLPDPDLPSDLSAIEWREALRACKGMVLRHEVYELDIDDLGAIPPQCTPTRLFSAATHNCRIQCLQRQGEGRHAVFLVTESEAITYHHELPLREGKSPISSLIPDPRIAHTLNLRHDEYGNPQQAVVIGYPRWQPGDYATLPRPEVARQVQDELHLAYSETRYTNDALSPVPNAGDRAVLRHHRLRLPWESLTYELKAIEKADARYYAPQDFGSLVLSGLYDPPDGTPVGLLEYHEQTDDATPHKRIVEHLRTEFFDDGGDAAPPAEAKPFGELGARGLKHQDYKLALTDALLRAVFGAPDAADPLADKLGWEISSGVTARGLLGNQGKSGYVAREGQYWLCSGVAGFEPEAHEHFFLPDRFTDAFGNKTSLVYGPNNLYIESSRDALGNTTTVDRFDYRVLAPAEMVDINNNRSEVAFDIRGSIVALAVKGKGSGTTWQGDHLAGWSFDQINPSAKKVAAFCTSRTFGVDEEVQARNWLGTATTRFVYHFGEAYDGAGNPIWLQRMAGCCAVARETHVGKLQTGQESKLQISLECTDGSGAVLMKKQRAEPEISGAGANRPAQLVIDDFSTGPFQADYVLGSTDGSLDGQAQTRATQDIDRDWETPLPLQSPTRLAARSGGDTLDTQAQTGAMAGGERFWGLLLRGEPGQKATVNIHDNPGAFTFESALGVAHRFDWNYGNTYIRHTPMSLDLRGYNALRFRFLAVPRGLNFNVLLYFRGQFDNYAQLSVNIGPHTEPFELDFSFDSFRSRIADPTRPADFSQVSGIYIVTQSGGYFAGGGESFSVSAISAVSLPRWLVNGLTVHNNKGKPAKQFEPTFSDDFGCELPAANGACTTMFYDAPGRLVRTEFADGTLSRVEFSPWHVKTFDQNDTVRESQWYLARSKLDPKDKLAIRINGLTDADPEQRAGWLAARAAGTPSQTLLDSLGREVIAIAHNRVQDTEGALTFNGEQWKDEYYETFTKLDAEGKPLWIRDARGNLVMQYLTPPKATRWADEPNEDVPYDEATGKKVYSAPCYDIAGRLLFQHSMDAGDRWMLMDAAGKPMLAWDFNTRLIGARPNTSTRDEWRLYRTEYDALHRPTKQWVTTVDSARNVTSRSLVADSEYRDTQGLSDADLAAAQAQNLIGQPVNHWDPSGLATLERIDLSGQPAHITRTLIKVDPARDDDSALSWNVTDRRTLLEVETFIHLTEHDALGRMTLLYNWHRDITFAANGAQRPTPGETNRVAIYEPAYNERGALRSERLHVRAGKTTPDGQVIPDTTTAHSADAIKAITYNKKGQKLTLALGNGTTTRYTYDEKTFRLTRLFTRRSGAIANGDCSSNTAEDRSPTRPCGVQNLSYTYDAVGNITHIQDDAQDSVFFNGAFVEPSNDYTYDALYRLTEATGRENAAAMAPPPATEGPWPPNATLPSADALRKYKQRYVYDEVGNFLTMQHLVDGNCVWKRRYMPALDSNRLFRTWYCDPDWDGPKATDKTEYRHDPHGNMLNLRQTPESWGLDIRWDWRDMIGSFDAIGGGVARYHYGIDKQRTRKHITRDGDVVEDRIYLGGYELYRRYLPAADRIVVEEIESLHLFEGEQRVLLMDDVVSTRGARPDGLSVKAQTLFRYQFGNHLGSVGLELDEAERIISYEEFHPYGTTAYRKLNSALEVPAKRYRFTGMERDEESGLSSHGARLHFATLGLWVAADPLGVEGGLNLYKYCDCCPINRIDPGGTASFLSSGSWSGSLLSSDESSSAAQPFLTTDRYAGSLMPSPLRSSEDDPDISYHEGASSSAAGSSHNFEGAEIHGRTDTQSMMTDWSRAKASSGDLSYYWNQLEVSQLRGRAIREGQINGMKFAATFYAVGTAGALGGYAFGLLGAGAAGALEMGTFGTFVTTGASSGFGYSLASQGAGVGLGFQKSFSARQLAFDTVLGGGFGALSAGMHWYSFPQGSTWLRGMPGVLGEGRYGWQFTVKDAGGAIGRPVGEKSFDSPVKSGLHRSHLHGYFLGGGEKTIYATPRLNTSWMKVFENAAARFGGTLYAESLQGGGRTSLSWKAFTPHGEIGLGIANLREPLANVPTFRSVFGRTYRIQPGDNVFFGHY